jgi:hypothetical protein
MVVFGLRLVHLAIHLSPSLSVSIREIRGSRFWFQVGVVLKENGVDSLFQEIGLVEIGFFVGARSVTRPP